MRLKKTLAAAVSICLIAACGGDTRECVVVNCDEKDNNANGTPNNANSSTNANTSANANTNSGSNNVLFEIVDPNISRDPANPKTLTLGEQTPLLQYHPGSGDPDDPENLHYWTFTRPDTGQYQATVEHDAADGLGAFFQSCIEAGACACAGLGTTNCTEENGGVINLLFIESDTTFLMFSRPTVNGFYRVTVNGPI